MSVARRLPFSLFLGLRYLKPKRTFVSIITIISILGVTLGIAVLIVVISVMTGFDLELRRKVLDFEPNLVIAKSDDLLDDWQGLSEKIQKNPKVIATAPFVQGPVIAKYQGRVLTPQMRGIDPLQENKIVRLADHIIEGKLALDSDSAVIGVDMAQTLGIGVGDVLSVSGVKLDEILKAIDEVQESEKKDLSHIRELVLPADLTVTGIFKTGRYVYDSNFIVVPLYIGQELYALDNRVHGITVKTADPYDAPAVKNELLTKLDPSFSALTWIDLNATLFDSINMERNVMFFILLIISVVAAFCVMNTLITVTVLKTREIGIMKALGATTGQIIWVFLSQGMIVGLFGSLVGVCSGVALVSIRNEFRAWLAQVTGMQIFPADVYQFSEIPAKIIPHDIAIICLTAFAFCSLAALIPAFFAARLDPVKALRSE